MSNFVLKNWKDRVVFSDQGPQPQVLEENSTFKLVLAGLEAGQQIPVHPEAASVFTILQGSGWMTVDDERFPIEAGAVITLGDGSRRGIEATSSLAFLAIRMGSD